MMATHLRKNIFLLGRSSRGYAAGAQLLPIGGSTNYEVCNSNVNGIVVTSAENDAPISRISIVIRAGARNESGYNLGVSHVLRICAGLSTKNTSQFAIQRHIQQVGASLHCMADRETISYTLEGTRSAVEQVLPFLTEVATQQVFSPWEVSDNTDRLRLELATRPPQLRVVDLLHKAAYRSTGLGNSLFIAKHQLGKISTETLQHYVQSLFTKNRAVVSGLGVNHKDLCSYAETLELGSGGDKNTPSPYKGGEIRCDKGGNLAFIAIAGEGVALNSKEAPALAVLQRTLGTGPHVRYGASDNGVLRTNIKVNDKYAISALNVSYQDTGLFGVLIASSSDTAGQITEAALKVLKNGKVSDADVQRGKNQLRTAILSSSENGRSVVRKLGTYGALTGSGISPTVYAETIDQVTTQDVNNVLSKVGRSKLSIASFGNLYSVPYLADLK